MFSAANVGMNTLLPRPQYPSAVEELQSLQKHWCWFLALGIAMVVIGSFAVSSACVVTLTVTITWLFGFLLLGGGIVQVASAFTVGRWSGTLTHLLLGVLYAVVGLMIIDEPADSAVRLTLMLALFMVVSGMFRIVSSLIERYPGWGWVLLNGTITLLLGMLIKKQWPLSGLWVIGLFAGIDLLLNGWAWIMLAFAARRASSTAGSSGSSA